MLIPQTKDGCKDQKTAEKWNKNQITALKKDPKRQNRKQVRKLTSPPPLKDFYIQILAPLREEAYVEYFEWF